ncbi:leucyl/phenylalanyl-tRNA--protein transferase [Photobacterium leiognathi]|uniref:leucyl/phenylalanyl-tRNA--protein transferase n=1 Tax=Photobacterium leiognathi TaxID=553611 RepID=UPI000769EB6E|nr:leucyl/phenylalanyl-tRNA--protein transferase [Photobacterium leiognathi]
MTIYLPEIDTDSYQFPHPSNALEEPNGLLAMGGDLSPLRLHNAYREGIFPWFSEGDPLLWWSPTPRGIFDPSTFRPSRSLRKFFRKSGYKITINKACHDVIRHCASCRAPAQTWITEEMISAYQTLHDLGFCHSVEVWADNELVGGFYGVEVGTIFCGESMFSLADNASKIALWQFCRYFTQQGGTLIDCQMMNPHLESLGAETLERNAFLQHLYQQRDIALASHTYQSQPIPVAQA